MGVAQLHGHSSPHLRFGYSLVELPNVSDWLNYAPGLQSRLPVDDREFTLTAGTYRLIGEEGWGPG